MQLCPHFLRSPSGLDAPSGSAKRAESTYCAPTRRRFPFAGQVTPQRDPGGGHAEKIRDRIRRHSTATYSEAGAHGNSSSQALASVENYLKSGGFSGGTEFEDADIQVKLVAGESNWVEAAANHARRSRTIIADLHRVRSAPLPASSPGRKCALRSRPFLGSKAPRPRVPSSRLAARSSGRRLACDRRFTGPSARSRRWNLCPGHYRAAVFPLSEGDRRGGFKPAYRRGGRRGGRLKSGNQAGAGIGIARRFGGAGNGRGGLCVGRRSRPKPR